MVPIASSLTHPNKSLNPLLKSTIDSLIPLTNSKSQFALDNLPLHKSHSVKNFAAYTLQKSDSKECEQSEQLSPMKPIFDTNLNSHNKFFKLGAKIQNFNYKYYQPKDDLLFAQNLSSIHYSKNSSINVISNTPRVKSNKSTCTLAQVNFSENSPSNTTLETNTSSKTETTPSTSALDTTDGIRMIAITNRIFKEKLLEIFTGKDIILTDVRDCVIRKVEERLKDIRPYIHSYWRDMSVKNGCLCIDERIAIPKAIKDAVLEDIHSTHPGSFAMLSLAQNIWWPYIHREILANASECKACTEVGK